jgi:hypothetical protein
MADEDVFADVQKREEALLRRCRLFILGHPRSPGNGHKDFVYFTPCGRWLRVCSATLINRDPDWSHVEQLEIMNPGRTAALFDEYGITWPTELEDQVANFEIKSSRYENRNGLELLLVKWAEDWPDVNVPDAKSLQIRAIAESLTENQRAILRTLEREGLRLTTGKICSTEPMTNFGVSTIKQSLITLKKLSLLDNNHRAKPKGYGLTRQGREVARVLQTRER